MATLNLLLIWLASTADCKRDEWLKKVSTPLMGKQGLKKQKFFAPIAAHKHNSTGVTTHADGTAFVEVGASAEFGSHMQETSEVEKLILQALDEQKEIAQRNNELEQLMQQGLKGHKETSQLNKIKQLKQLINQQEEISQRSDKIKQLMQQGLNKQKDIVVASADGSSAQTRSSTGLSNFMKTSSVNQGPGPVALVEVSHNSQTSLHLGATSASHICLLVFLTLLLVFAAGAPQMLRATTDQLSDSSSPDGSPPTGALSEVAKYLGEFVGTFVLVVTVGTAGGDAVWAPASIGSALAVMIYAIGPVSGANFNPAVSLAIFISGKSTVITTLIYMVAQVLGGFVGFLTVSMLIPSDIREKSPATFGPLGEFGWIEAAAVEILYTMFLCFVVLNVACSPKTGNSPNQFFGLSIGFVIIAAAYGIGGISGCFLNPAIALSNEFVIGAWIKSAGITGWSGIFTGFQMLGAVLASLLHRVVRPQEYGLEYSSFDISKYVCEYLGTFFLVMTAACNIASGSPAGAFSIAASLMSVIFAMGNVSGAHFNPAVTLAIQLSGRGCMDFHQLPGYISSQILGGLSGAFVSVCLYGKAKALHANFDSGFGTQHAALAEMLFTFVLCFIVLSVATTREPLKDLFGWAIGSCVIVGGVAIGGISGGSLNPAVSIGLNLIAVLKEGGPGFSSAAAYTAAELFGAIMATACFSFIHHSEYEGTQEPDTDKS